MRTDIPAFPSDARGVRIASALALAFFGLAAASAFADDIPVLKSGLWELSRSTSQQPEQAHDDDVPR